jgi:hypothetical protein
MRNKRSMNSRKWRNYKKGSNIMSDVNTVNKYTRLGSLSTKNVLFKNIHGVIVGYEKGMLQVWAHYYKELLTTLGKGIVPEEKVCFGLYQDIRTSFIQEGPAMIRKLKDNKASVEDWMYIGFISSIGVEVPLYCFMS